MGDGNRKDNPKIHISILGSCVSRLVLLNGDYMGKGVADERLALHYYFARCNLVCIMLPPPFSAEEVDSIEACELWDASQHRALKQALDKSVMGMLLEDEAEYLLIDLYDFMTPVACVNDTMFSTDSYEFFNTKLYREKYKDEIGAINLFELPSCLWYGYVDLFFEKALKKYDGDHIILNRMTAATHYINTGGGVLEIPETSRRPYHANARYNDGISRLENYIIRKYHVRSLNLTGYFMPDERYWSDIMGAHYQKEFYEESLQAILGMCLGGIQEREWDRLSARCVSKILDRDLKDDGAYLAYLRHIRSPFHTGCIFDEYCAGLKEEEIVRNREFLSHLYAVIDQNRLSMSDPRLSEPAKVELILEAIDDGYSEDPFASAFMEYVLMSNSEDAEEAIRYLKEIFFGLMESQDLRWAAVLERMERINPEDGETLSLRLSYLKAVGDWDRVRLYEEKLRRAERGEEG